jgi:PAS domain S-box-containing protein
MQLKANLPSLELIIDHVIFSNDQGNIVEANESFETVCGSKRKELCGKTDFELFSSRDD